MACSACSREESITAIVTIQAATNEDQETVQAAVSASRIGKNMTTMKANEITSGLQTLSDIDKVADKVLDVNSLMKALDDYIAKASTGGCGVPINYYLKDITKDMLAEMWVAKYYPGEFMAIKYDDTEDGPAASAAPATA